MPDLFKVKDWETHFENSESRKIKSLTWLPVKNKHDGKGYRRVCNHPKSVQVFCAWSLILQVASKMPARGVLRDEDGPLTASDLAFKTGYPEHIFREAFQVLIDPKIGWLTRESVPASPESSGAVGAEGKGIEQDRTEHAHTIEADKERGVGGNQLAEIPSKTEVEVYSAVNGISAASAVAFFNYYEGRNLWLNKHGRAVNWKLLLKQWAERDRQNDKNTQSVNTRRYGKNAVDRNAGTLNDHNDYVGLKAKV